VARQEMPASPKAPDMALLGLLPDAPSQAQPVQVIALGPSPFVYQALYAGTVVISGGTVSAVEWSRDGSTYYAVTGAVPVSRLDRVRVTYSAVPNMEFFPR